MCFSSKGTTESNTVSKFEPPAYTQPGWQQYTQQSVDLGNAWQQNPDQFVYGYDPTTGTLDPNQAAQMRVAPMSDQQNAAIGGIQSLAGSPVWNQAYQHAYNTLGGDYAQHAEYNPFGGYTNPYMEDMIAQSNADITKGYGQGTAAQTDAAAAMSGAFGGSAYGDTVQNNQRTLGDTLARNVTGIRQNQYTNAANLEQQRIATENANYEAERQRQMQTMGLIPGMMSGQAGIEGQQFQMGAAQQQQYQSYLDALRSIWNEQLQAPLIGLDISGAGLTRASGGAGTTSTQMLGPGYTPMQTGLAGALGLGGLYSLFGGGK